MNQFKDKGKQRQRLFLLFLIIPILAIIKTGTAVATSLSETASMSKEVLEQAPYAETYGRLPLYFEANQGQTDTKVKFLSRGSSNTLFLTSTEAVLLLSKPSEKTEETRTESVNLNDKLTSPMSNVENPKMAVFRMNLVNANPEPRVVGLNEQPGKVNYFIGKDTSKWLTNVPIYTKVKFKDVYPGIDLELIRK